MKRLHIYARQGDLIIDRKGDYVPSDAHKTTTPTVLAGSHGREHALPPGVVYERKGRIHNVSTAESIVLTHADPRGHKDVTLSPGMYEIFAQVERRGDGDSDIED